MEGVNWKRMGISLLLAGFFGAGCAYGTSTAQIPGFTATMPYLLTIFYGRLLMGFIIGLAGGVVLVKGALKNAALRGGTIGAVCSIGISFYGGAAVFITAGIVYGVITDCVATRLSGKKR